MDKFTIEITELADVFKALSHPARIEILNVLADKNVCICGEIVEVLPLSQSTVSQHLKELKRVGLIQGEIEGKKSCYCINWNKINELDEQFGDFLQNLLQAKSNSNQCC